MTNPVYILLAEDSGFVQQVAVSVLNKYGYCVDCVGNGREAVAALTKTSYALVLMDVQMPVMDGLEATRLIRGGGEKVLNANLPIIALTGNDSEGDRACCLEAGMDDYLPKPFSERTLIEILVKWLPSLDQGEPKNVPGLLPEQHLAPGSPVFDRQELLLRLGSEAVVPRLIAMFLEQLPPELRLLRELIAENNPAAAWGQAHKIKGMAANASCRALSAMALQMEKAGKAGDLAAMTTILPWLEKLFARVRGEMEKSCGK